MGAATVTVSVASFGGDGTGMLQVADGVRVLAVAQPNSSFAADSHYQTSEGELVADGAGGAGDGNASWLVSWQRLYYLGGSTVLS